MYYVLDIAIAGDHRIDLTLRGSTRGPAICTASVPDLELAAIVASGMIRKLKEEPGQFAKYDDRT